MFTPFLLLPRPSLIAGAVVTASIASGLASGVATGITIIATVKVVTTP